MNKRGQFYLIAALVVVGLIAGLATVYNSAKSLSEDIAVYDLSEEIIFEGSQVLASGVFNAQEDDQIVQNVENLTEYYAKTNPNSELIVIYGDTNELHYIIYNNTVAGTISIQGSSGETSELIIPGRLEKRKGTITPGQDHSVEIRLGPNAMYNFDVKPGKQFYIILRKEKQDETFVAIPGGQTGERTEPSPGTCPYLYDQCMRALFEACGPQNESCMSQASSSCQTLKNTCIQYPSCTWSAWPECKIEYGSESCDSFESCSTQVNSCNTRLASDCQSNQLVA